MKSILLAASALAAMPSLAQTSSVRQEQPVLAAPDAKPGVASPKKTGAVAKARARRSRTPSSAELRVRAANGKAIREPEAPAFVNATQVYPFAEGVLYRLFAAPGQVSDIALQSGEAIVAVAAGDTARWTVGDTTSGTGDTRRVHILVKPFAAGLSTNLVITTDRRSYHLALTSTSGTAMAALAWTYPNDALLAIGRAAADARAAAPVARGIEVDRLHFGYAISGDHPSWRPLRAFDDGRQTFIEFPPTLAVGEAPPLFLLDARGKVELVNYRVHGRFYVVDRIFDRAELRLGTKHQQIVRISRMAKDAPARSGS